MEKLRVLVLVLLLAALGLAAVPAAEAGPVEGCGSGYGLVVEGVAGACCNPSGQYGLVGLVKSLLICRQP